MPLLISVRTYAYSGIVLFSLR